MWVPRLREISGLSRTRLIVKKDPAETEEIHIYFY